jgi:glutathione S-transferase
VTIVLNQCLSISFSIIVRYEEIYINLVDEPDWYLKKNPLGQVPLLEWIDPNSNELRSITESLIVSDYLDEIYPDNQLHPSDPYVRATQRVLIDRFGGVSDDILYVE